MLQKLILSAAVSGALILSSCGTAKKLDAANAQIQDLQSTNSQLQTANADLQKQVDNLIAANKSVNAEYSKYRTTCEADKQKLQVARAILLDQAETLEQVTKKLEEGLADFNAKGVEVYEKDGYVYVSMEDNLLYKSGSSTLSADGKKALAPLASALADYPNLKVVVVGNTDDQKFKKGTMDNLSLSTERANGVVRTLVTDYNVDPLRLTSAGKGKFNPVADNSTPEGRAKNRRTDIILNPDLTKLWESAQAK